MQVPNPTPQISDLTPAQFWVGVYAHVRVYVYELQSFVLRVPGNFGLGITKLGG